VNDPTFLASIQELSSRILIAAETLGAMVGAEPLARVQMAARIRSLNEDATRLSRALLDETRRRLFTPLDREDVTRLVAALDGVLDVISGTASQCGWSEVGEPIPHSSEMCDLILAQAREIAAAVRNFEDDAEMARRCMSVRRLERDADRLFLASLYRLLEGHGDAIDVLRRKGVLSELRQTSRRAHGVAAVCQTLMVNYS
jgi:uncharacterized protein Yka (UPF0111/DUF47 family)